MFFLDAHNEILCIDNKTFLFKGILDPNIQRALIFLYELYNKSMESLIVLMFP